MSIQAMARGAFFCKRLCEGRGICFGRVKEFVLLGSRSFPRQGQGLFVGKVEESAFPGRVKEFRSVGSRNLHGSVKEFGGRVEEFAPEGSRK